MKTARTRLQKFLSYAVTSTLAIQALGIFLPTASVEAAAGDLVINEIHWAGSTGNASDEWIELYNNSGATINFTATPFSIEVSDATNTVLETVMLGAGVPNLANGQYLVVHNNPAGSTLDAGSLIAYEPAADFNLPNIATNYRILDNASVEVDAVKAAAVGDPIPFAGSAIEPRASMQRTSPTTAGTNPASWTTSQTVGANFITAVEQYGTPGAANVNLAAPTSNVFTPLGSTNLPAAPTLSGSTSVTATSVVASISIMGPVPGTLSQVFPVSASTYSGTLSLPAGRYQIAVASLDAAGNRSAWSSVAANAALNEFNYVVLASSSAVTSPTMGGFSAVTNNPTPVFSGTATGATEVDVLRNGEYYQTVAVVSDAFSFTLPLVPNSSNSISVVAVAATGAVSVPTSFTVLHDGIAPAVINASKVVVTSNLPGTNDIIAGLPMAAEFPSTLRMYKDAALTMQIGSVVAVNADGSFAAQNLGDNLYPTVYLQLQDVAGNVSPVAVFQNPITFIPATGITIQLGQLLENQASFSWNPIAGAVNYTVKYRAADGTFGPAMKLCVPSSPSCTPSVTLINLSSATNYVLAVAAVDVYGNSTVFTEYNFKTAATPVVTTPEAAETTIVPASVTTPIAKKTTVKPAPTPVPTVTPSPTPEVGEVKSSTDVADTNYTPWIILGVLIGIAALATLGYFYWFGGAAGEAALAAAAATKAKAEQNGTKSSTTAKKPGSKEKRW